MNIIKYTGNFWAFLIFHAFILSCLVLVISFTNVFLFCLALSCILQKIITLIPFLIKIQEKMAALSVNNQVFGLFCFFLRGLSTCLVSVFLSMYPTIEYTADI